MLEAARDPSAMLYVTSQILCEFYSVITNPRRVAVASSPTEALRVISALLALPGLRVLPIPANGVQRIYTFNADDFEVFPELAVVTS